jgi:hypothetical protein
LKRGEERYAGSLLRPLSNLLKYIREFRGNGDGQMSRFVLACLFIAVTSFISTANSAMIAQPDISKVVTFIFTADKTGNLKPRPKNK